MYFYSWQQMTVEVERTCLFSPLLLYCFGSIFNIRFIFLLSAQYKKINLIYLLVLCTVEEGKSFISTVSHDIGVNILFRESSLLLILFRESNLLLNNDRQHGKSDIELPPCIAEFLTFTLFHYFLFISTGQNHLLYTRDTNPLLCVTTIVYNDQANKA